MYKLLGLIIGWSCTLAIAKYLPEVHVWVFSVMIYATLIIGGWILLQWAYKERCGVVLVPSVLPGWGCCKCQGYNSFLFSPVQTLQTYEVLFPASSKKSYQTSKKQRGGVGRCP